MYGLVRNSHQLNNLSLSLSVPVSRVLGIDMALDDEDDHDSADTDGKDGSFLSYFLSCFNIDAFYLLFKSSKESMFTVKL